MTLIAVIPALVALVGLLVYLLVAHPKIAELGRLAWACGLLVFLFSVAAKVVKIGT